MIGNLPPTNLDRHIDVRSDRLTSPYGRRRPIILAGLVSTWIAGILRLGQQREVISLKTLGFKK